MLLKIKVSDKTEFVKYENKNFSVGQTDDLFVNVKKILDIYNKYRH